MRRALKKFAVLFLFSTLSLQGFAAVAMPFCQHQPIQHHAVMSGHDLDAHQHDEASSNPACDDCAFCQLCTAPALPDTTPLTAPDFSAAFNPESAAHFFLFVPEQTQHPPLSFPA